MTYRRAISAAQDLRAVAAISWSNMVYMQPLTSARSCMVLVLVLLSMVSQTKSLAAGSEAMPSVVVQLARVLHDSPQPMRSDFAWLALSQMAEFYNEEAVRARMEARNSARARDAAQWAASVEDYAREISTLADSITPATPIDIRAGVDDSVQIYVGKQPVILTGAISGQQSVYEQRVLERFCILYSCEDLLPEIELGAAEMPATVSRNNETTVYWSFSQQAGPVCVTSDGLEFQFQQMTGLGEKREACTRVVAELGELIGTIIREQQQGVKIDWDTLEVLPAPADEQQRVRLAARVEVRLELPMLNGKPQLLKIVRPWLQARVRGDSFSLVVLNAEHLMGLNGGHTRRQPASQRYPAFNTIQP